MRRLACCAIAVGLAACAGGRKGPPGGGPLPQGDAPPGTRRGDIAGQSDQLKVLQSIGLLANGLPMPFTGSVAVLPGPTADSAYVVVSLSMPTVALSFNRENDRFRGSYAVAVEVRQSGTVVARIESNQVVRVASYKETQRSEESILFQQQLLVAPGSYSLAVLVKDGSTSRSGAQEKPITVPRFTTQPSTPVIAMEGSLRANSSAPPDFLANARNTVVLGSETDLPLYVEVLNSGPAGVPLNVAVRDGSGATLWQDSVVLTQRGNLASSVVRVPVAGLGVGVVNASVWRPGGRDTVTQQLLVTFGEDLPITSFDEMISYLRFFAPTYKLNALKNGTAQERAIAWATFLRETDPITITPQNEALRDYFGRIRIANTRFREDGGLGWLSDRGMTYVGLGEPEQMLDLSSRGSGSSDMSIGERGRQQVWDYPSMRLRLVFIDVNGFGRWKFAGSGASEFQSALQRRMAR